MHHHIYIHHVFLETELREKWGSFYFKSLLSNLHKLEIVFLFCLFSIKPHLYPLVQLPQEWQLTLGIKISLSTLVLTVHLAEVCDFPVKGS